MATKKPIIPMTMKVRSADGGLDFQGSIKMGVVLAFLQLQDKPKTRAALLAELQEKHAEMLAREPLAAAETLA